VPAGQGPQPGQQLVDLERLGQVVLGARVESFDSVGERTQRGQQQDRGRDAPASQAADQVDALDRRQASIDDHHRVGPGEGQVQSLLAVAGQIDFVAGVAEQFGEHGRQLPVVLDEQQSVPAGAHTGNSRTLFLRGL
jgi:hypothetical protein